MKISRPSLACGCLLLCSCSTTPPPSAFVPASEWPTTVAMNEDAGRGNLLIVTLGLEHGNEMPFIVDTGDPVTCLDESLEPKLGKRIGEGTALSASGQKHKMNLHAAPKLYLGNTRLMTGSVIFTMDLKGLASHVHCPIMGILGMDCMIHYCIQLDFKAKQVRFLSPNELNVTGLGKAFPLIFSSAGQAPGHGWCSVPCIKSPPFTFFSARQGGKRRGRPLIHLVDTGDNGDGSLSPALFRREVREQRLEAEEDIDELHLNQNTMWFDKCVWDGETYTNLIVGNGGGAIGLRFLARHLVTFNFPQRVMYLKQTSIGPLADGGKEAAWKFILACTRKKGGLPGGPPHGAAFISRTSNCKEIIQKAYHNSGPF